MSTFSGIGYDSHPLVAGRRLVLGGVEIPGDVGLEGHSDADVLTHAIIDALLGAAGLGDIGQHFPDDDPAYRDADSLELLTQVAQLLQTSGLTVLHVDATVILENPRVAPHREDVITNLSTAIGVARGHVNVKATTGEGMGFVGRGEGAAALAIATVEST